ncbi:hypothetical protein P3W45_000968 [Vairimorpha bombi]
MWIYKNLIDIYRSGQLQDILSMLIHVSIEDYSYGCTIYDDICSLVFQIYDIKHEDTELKFIYRQDYQEDVKEIKMKDEIENSLFVLCTPIMDCCLKQVVDVFTYIYKINHNFENINKLLDKYNKRSDILIELLLLKMKLSHQNKSNDGIDDMLLRLNISKDTDSRLKNLLLEYEDSNLNFFIENICIYLEYKEDDDFIYKLKGIYNYQYFIKWSMNCFKNLSVLKINDFVEISRLFINYYRKEKDNHKELLEMLNLLIKLDISYVSERIRANILEYVDEVIEDNAFIRHFVIESSDNPVYKKVLVKKMGILKYFSVEEKNKIVTNLFKDFDLNWRYRKTLIEECIKHLDLLGFKNNNWLKHFDNDKVFYIREMCKKLRKDLLDRDIININADIKKDVINSDIKKDVINADIKKDVVNSDIKKDVVNSEKEIVDKADFDLKNNSIEKNTHIENNFLKQDKINEEDFIDFNKSNILNTQELKSGIQNTKNTDQKEIFNKLENIKTVTDEILDKKPLENNDILRMSSEIKKDEIFEKLKNNVKNKIKSIEEKIVFVSEKNNESEK